MCTSGRGQVLLPWPNRIEDGTLRVRRAPPRARARRAASGETRSTDSSAGSAWTVAEREPGRVVMEHELHPRPGYPFSLAVRDRVHALRRRARGHDDGDERRPEPCPYGCGAHPYLTLGTPTVDPVVLTCPGATCSAPTTAASRRSGSRRRHGVRLHAAAADRRDAARQLLHRPRARRGRPRTRRAPRAGRRRGADALAGRGATATCMLFTGDPLPDVDRRSLAVEPMTCPPNAFRTGEALIRLEPGESFTSSVGDHATRRDLVAAGAAAGCGLPRPRPRRGERRRDPLQAPPPDRPAHSRARDRARDPHRARRAGPRGGRQPHRLPRRPRPRVPVLLRRPRAGRAPRGSPVAHPRNDRLGDLARARPRRRPRPAPGGPRRGAWLLGVALSTTALGTLVPILADAGLLPTPLGSAVLGRASRASSGRSSSSRSSSPARTAPSPRRCSSSASAPSCWSRRLPRSARARPASSRVLQQTVHTTGQAAVRLSVLVLAALVFLAIEVGLRLRARRVRRRPRRRPGAGLAGGRARAHAAGGHRLRVPDPDLLRRHRDDLRPRQPADADRPRPRGALPRALRRHPRHARLLWLRDLGPRQTLEPRPLRRHRPAADRRDRRDRHRSRRDRRRRRHVAHRRRDDLGARPAAAGDGDREPGIIPPG